MKTIIIKSLTIVGLIVLAGCIPERVSWSPDGKRAAVLGNDGLRLCDPDGHLTPLLINNVTQAAWLPDSQGLVISINSKANHWEQIQSKLTKQQIKQLTTIGTEMRNQSLTGEKWDVVAKEVLRTVADNQVDAIKLFIRDNYTDEPTNKLVESWGKLNSPLMFEMYVVKLKDQTVDMGPNIATTLVGGFGLRVAPDGRAVVFTTSDDFEEDRGLNLWIAPTEETNQLLQLSKRSAMFPDWTADGKHLVYVEQGRENKNLGALIQQKVRNDAGQIQIDKKRVELAGTYFHNLTRVRCLSDGRIIFSSLEVNLPSTRHDMPQRQQLFSVDPSRQPTVSRITPRRLINRLPDGLSFFELSPDESRIAILGDEMNVEVYELASGKIVTAEPNAVTKSSSDIDNLLTMPNWRNNDELCFAHQTKIPKQGQHKWEIVLWSNGKITKVLSKDWPEAVTKDFLY